MKYEFFIGWRYMLAKRKVKFISMISLISVSGVALGVMSLIVVISVMNGFDRDLREKILGAKSHLLIQSFFGFTEYPEMIEEVQKDENVEAAAPAVILQGLLAYRNAAMGISVKGVDPDLEEKVTKLSSHISVGSLDPLRKEIQESREAGTTPKELVTISSLKPTYGGIILGKEVAKSIFGLQIPPGNKQLEKEILATVVGQKVRFTSPEVESTPAGKIPRTETLEVAGIFDLGLFDYDSTLVIMSLPTAQRLFNRHDKAMLVEMYLKDLNLVDETAERLGERLEKRFGKFYELQTWKQMNFVFFRALKIEKLAMFVILVLIVLVAAFNIASTLIMIVMEKTKDIGILMSMGAKAKSVMTIFMFEGAVTALLGTFLGSAGGVAICEFLKYYKISMPGGGDIYYIDTLPVEMLWSDFIFIVGTTLLVSLLASFYPAWQASRMIPTEALRYE